MKEINVKEAADWSEEEYEFNLHYLRTRLRFKEADKATEIREGKPKRSTKKSKSAHDGTDEEAA